MERVRDPKIAFPSFVLFLLLVFLSLNYFNILRLDYAFPFLSFLPRQKEKVATQTDPFKGPVKLKNSPFLFYVITGRILELKDSSDKKSKLMYVLKADGTNLDAPLVIPAALVPVLIETKGGKVTEGQIAVDKIERKDTLMISINENPDTGKKEVTGIRVNRID